MDDHVVLKNGIQNSIVLFVAATKPGRQQICRRLKENQEKTKYVTFVAAFTHFVEHKTTSKCLDENKVTTIQKCVCDCVIIILYMYLGVLNGKNT